MPVTNDELQSSASVARVYDLVLDSSNPFIVWHVRLQAIVLYFRKYLKDKRNFRYCLKLDL